MKVAELPASEAELAVITRLFLLILGIICTRMFFKELKLHLPLQARAILKRFEKPTFASYFHIELEVVLLPTQQD